MVTISERARRAAFELAEGGKAHLRRVVKARELELVAIRPGLQSASLIMVLVVKDEALRFPFLLEYYRARGVEHFLVVDNQSTDGLQALLSAEEDVSVYVANGRYGQARYGNDWINAVCSRHCSGKWVLYADADEFLVMDGADSITDACRQLDRAGRPSLHTVMVDMYSRQSAEENIVSSGQDPLTVCDLFDRSGYEYRYEPESQTTWIKGGVRGRLFFPDVQQGPALNKTPLIKWRRHYAFLKSAHQAWPTRLNAHGESVQGALLHFKFTATAVAKMTDASSTREHTTEYEAYAGVERSSFEGEPTTRYTGPSDFVRSGIITSLY